MASSYKTSAREGKMQGRGRLFNPGAALSSRGAEAAVAELNVRRPGTTRYPIDLKAFAKLKVQSKKAAKLAKPESTVATDKARSKQELASRAGGGAAMLEAAPPAAAPSSAANFAGIAATGWLPPDCTLAAGPQHLLASVNSSVAVYNKTGGAALIRKTLTAWFSNVIQQATIFDPKALYDQHAARWVLAAVAVAQNPDRSWFLLSVSKTSDPAGAWTNYALDATKDGTTATRNWADYPALGVDSKALYLTANMFRFDGDFQYAKLRIIPKQAVYAGGTITFKDIVRLKNADGSMAFTVQPCHTYGAPQVQYLVNSYYPTSANPTQNKLSLWSLTNPLVTPALSRSTITTSAYGLAPDAAQQGGGTPIDSGDIRILNAVFRGGSVWAGLTTRHRFGSGSNVAAIHWFQINPTSGALVQQGIYGANARHYFNPAVMPDNNGNMVLGFSRCGTTEFCSIHFTGRKASDPLGQLQSSALLKTGTANYLGLDSGGRNRWGDYAGITSDPAAGRVVWFYNEYATAGNKWATWIGSAFF